jgi:hypothetical protein
MATIGVVTKTKKQDIFNLVNIYKNIFLRYINPNFALLELKAKADL